MMRRADLHTHTRCSDGLLEPADLVAQAQAAGIGILALTDHDTQAGVADALAAGKSLGLEVIPGVELSVREMDPHTGRLWDEHILGYFVDPTAPALLAYLDRLQQSRRELADETIGLLAHLGVPVEPARVAELAAGAVVTRPHIARALVDAGHVATEQEAFERFLGNGRPASPQRPAPTPAQAVATIQGAGGVAVLAHPVFGQEPGWAAKLADIPARLNQLAGVGVRGVECHYPDATPEITAQLVAWSATRGLIQTGGTDYHGPGKAPNAPLGQVTVPEEVVATLRAACSTP